MRPLVVVELDPVANDTAGMLQSLEAVVVAVDALVPSVSGSSAPPNCSAAGCRA